MKRTLLEATDYVLTELYNLGISVAPSTRFGRMSAIFKKQSFVPENSSDFPIACEALRDIQIMEFGFDQLLQVIPKNILKKKIKLIIQDSVLPEDNKGNSPGRDTQVELYVAAICQAAGLAPSFDEPDIVIALNKTKYALAIKRIKDIKQLEKRFRGAVDQIRRSKIPGYVVFDWTLAVNPNNKKIGVILSEVKKWFINFNLK